MAHYPMEMDMTQPAYYRAPADWDHQAEQQRSILSTKCLSGHPEASSTPPTITSQSDVCRNDRGSSRWLELDGVRTIAASGSLLKMRLPSLPVAGYRHTDREQ